MKAFDFSGRLFYMSFTVLFFFILHGRFNIITVNDKDIKKERNQRK